MTDMSKQQDVHSALSARKQQLVREGELYRVGVIHAKAQVSAALRPEALLQGALEQVVALAQLRVGALLQPGGLNSGNLRAMLPYVLTLASYLARRKLVKPALAVGATLGVGVAWLLRRKRS